MATCQPAAADALLDVTKSDRVMVDVFVDGPLTDAVAELEANGMQVLATATRPLPVVEGRLPLARLDAVAALDVVRGIQPVVGGGTDDWPGTKGTEGDTAHRGTAARALGGGDPLVRGKGVKVGIISDSIDRVGGGIADSVASGDLPAGRVVSLLDDTNPGVIDEGRAMAEIIYDTVPGVEQIVFSSGTSAGAVGKAASIDALVAQGVKVIGDDIFYLSEPFFQDGQVAQAVDRAKAAGVTYFASAGNRARQSWEGTYADNGGFHNFAGGDTTQTIVTVPAGRFIQVALQWNEPWGAATTDIDALLTKADGTALPGGTFGGDDDNLAGGLPSENVSWTNNTGAPVAVALRIQRFAGTGSPFMKYIARGPGAFTIAEHATNSDTINPDAASAPGSIAVAAVDASDPGLDTVEDFSSRGLKTRLRDKNGVLLTSPLVLQKPQLAAADGISTSVPAFAKFYGTSAAVPSAVGIAALLKWARPTLTPSQIEAIMTDPARSTDCLPVGIRPDADCGAGFVYADSSLQALDSTGPNVVASVTGPSGTNGWQTGDATVDWTVTDPESVITSGSCARVVITADTAGTTRECEAASIGGSTRASVTVKRDSTPPLPPVITGINGGSFSRGIAPPGRDHRLLHNRRHLRSRHLCRHRIQPEGGISHPHSDCHRQRGTPVQYHAGLPGLVEGRTVGQGAAEEAQARHQQEAGEDHPAGQQFAVEDPDEEDLCGEEGHARRQGHRQVPSARNRPCGRGVQLLCEDLQDQNQVGPMHPWDPVTSTFIRPA